MRSPTSSPDAPDSSSMDGLHANDDAGTAEEDVESTPLLSPLTTVSIIGVPTTSPSSDAETDSDCCTCCTTVLHLLSNLSFVSGFSRPREVGTRWMVVIAVVISLAVVGILDHQNVNEFVKARQYPTLQATSYMRLSPFSQCRNPEGAPLGMAPFPVVTLCSLPCVDSKCRNNATDPFEVVGCTSRMHDTKSGKWINSPCDYGVYVNPERKGEYCVTLNDYGNTSSAVWPLSSSRDDLIRLKIALADNSDIEHQPWQGIAVAYHSPGQIVSLLYGDQGIWRFVDQGMETRLSATAHLDRRHKSPPLFSMTVTANEILRQECACPYKQSLYYTINIDDDARLQRALADFGILSITLSDQEVLCSVQTVGKQFPELLSEVSGSFSLVPSVVMVFAALGGLLFRCCSMNCCKRRCGRWFSRTCFNPTVYRGLIQEDLDSLGIQQNPKLTNPYITTTSAQL